MSPASRVIPVKGANRSGDGTRAGALTGTAPRSASASMPRPAGHSHTLVPRSKDILLREPDTRTRWRCTSCGWVQP